MRARALRPGRDVATPAPEPEAPQVRSPSRAALVFLRGRDADGRLRELVRARATVRPRLGALAEALVRGRAYEKLGFRCLGDWSRERIGVGARAVGEWARVWRALRELPRLRAAVLAGEVSWTVVRRIVALATPENEMACLETVRGRTVRAVEAMIGAVRTVEMAAGAPEGVDAEAREERVRVRIACSKRLATKWAAAVELARRASGEQLSTWEAAEAIAGEAASAFGAPEAGEEDRGDERSFSRSGSASREHGSWGGQSSESGLRALRWPWLRWQGPNAAPADGSLETDLSDTPPLELDRRFRAAIAFLQRVDLEIGRILRQILERGLHRELGFQSFEDYVVERLDLSPRTARRLVRLARAPEAVATAFREGRITLLAAEAILRGAPLDETLTLRKLQEQLQPEIDFWAPPDVARLLLAMIASVGLERLLDHAIATWLALAQPGHEVFERDRWRCTVPACTARRNLHSHHVWFRSQGGPDEPWNLTTLCAWHHQRGVHGGGLRIWGRAPDGLRFELPVGRFRSHDRRLSWSPVPR
jgi:hypothetical protein